MRTIFRDITEDLLRSDERTVLLLGDIGVYGFRNSLSEFPRRVFNIGILEQATIGVAAGMALEGMLPIVHSIAPFLVERALEQIKIDFGYQELGGNLVSVGASLDYAALGGTHHAPGDVAAMLTIPGVQVLLPGTGEELGVQLRHCYSNHRLSYFRLSEAENPNVLYPKVGDVVEVKPGSRAAILAIGPTLEYATDAAADLDVAVFYMNSIDRETPRSLWACLSNFDRLLVVEPYYEGTSLLLLNELLGSKRILVRCSGIPRAFQRGYGSREQHYESMGLHGSGVRSKLVELLDA